MEYTVNETKMQLLGDSVLIKPLDGEKTTKSGIILPEIGKVKASNNKGEVVALGPLCQDLTVGGKVYYPRKKGSIIYLKDEEFLFLHKKDIWYEYK